ncbi:MAG TPA: hypothetical protein VEQ59_18180 [Polyangiaceae bacterium]|nr:hypothetical protein [Polyangiaceae bacterium]
MKTISRALGGAALLLGLGWVVGCSRSQEAAAPSPAAEAAPVALPTPASAPAPTDALASAPEPEPTTLADAEAMLERARADLDRLALNEPLAPRSAAPAAAGGGIPGSAAPKPSPGEVRRAEKSAAQDRAEAPKDTTSCDTACKAFSSLVRASDAVCRLDTEGGKRCERARHIREDAQVRVAGCGCPK